MNAADLLARLELQELRHRAQLAEMKLQQKNAEAKLEIERQVAARLQGQWLGQHRFSSGSGWYSSGSGRYSSGSSTGSSYSSPPAFVMQPDGFSAGIQPQQQQQQSVEQIMMQQQRKDAEDEKKWEAEAAQADQAKLQALMDQRTAQKKQEFMAKREKDKMLAAFEAGLDSGKE
jgi:hypothetical protein